MNLVGSMERSEIIEAGKASCKAFHEHFHSEEEFEPIAYWKEIAFFMEGAEWARRKLVHKPNSTVITEDEFEHQVYGYKNCMIGALEAMKNLGANMGIDDFDAEKASDFLLKAMQDLVAYLGIDDFDAENAKDFLKKYLRFRSE